MVSFWILYVTNNYGALVTSILLVDTISLILTVFHLDVTGGVSPKIVIIYDGKLL